MRNCHSARFRIRQRAEIFRHLLACRRGCKAAPAAVVSATAAGTRSAGTRPTAVAASQKRGVAMAVPAYDADGA
jgi:hypothetical protein